MRVTTCGAVEIHIRLRSVYRTADHAYYDNYLGVYHFRELRC